jgi:hypothetical protein
VWEGLASDVFYTRCLLLCPTGTDQPTHTNHPKTNLQQPTNRQMFYFPDSEGFRFRGGGNGVYFAAKDLHVAEISAAVSLSLRRTPGRPGGPPVARLSVSLTGAAGGGGRGARGGGGGEGAASVRDAVGAAEAARAAAAARADGARRAAMRSAGGGGKGAAAAAPQSPTRRSGSGRFGRAGGGGSGNWSDDFSGIGSPKKGRGVAKFLDNLSSRTEQLKGRLSAAAAASG